MGRAACPSQQGNGRVSCHPADWLVVERLPSYAPDLNPVEQVWSSLKRNELANVGAEGLGEVIAAA